MRALPARLSRAAFTLALPRLRLLHARPGAPLFVIGSGRSGNTLVRRVLLASGQIHIPPETFVLGDLIEGWPRSAALPWRQRVWLFCAHFEKHRHFDTFGLPNLDAFAAEAQEMRDRRLRPLIEAFFRFLARQAGSGATRWGDKSPWNTFHLPAIGQMFPDAQFLWLVRDGRDVALSYREAGLSPDFASAADRWTRANRDCARFARWSPNVLQVRYESLVTAPEARFAAIFDWAGLRFDPAMMDASVGEMGDVETHAHHAGVRRPISTASIGRWRHGMAGAEMKTAAPDFAAMLTRLGYS